MSRWEQFWRRDAENENIISTSESNEGNESLALPKFESIRETLWEREAITNLYNSFEAYIATSLSEKGDNFSDDEKNAIKIVLWGDFQNIFASQWSIWIFLNTIGHKIQSSLAPLTKIADGEDENKQKTLEGLLSTAGNVFKSFKENPENNLNVLEYLDSKIGDQISLLNKEKQENPAVDFTKAYEIQKILIWESSWSTKNNADVFKEIVERTESLGLSLEKKTNLWHNLAETIDNLPLSMGEYIKNILAGAPTWVMSLISILMWEGWLDTFLSWENKKRIESLKNLFDLSQNPNSSIANIFPTWFEDSFDVKNLEWFFKYAESKKIDHTKEWFWEEVISGKTDDSEIKEISNILKENYGDTILSSKDSEENWKWLSDKLNSLPRLIANRENAMREDELNASIAALPPIPTNTDSISTVERQVAFDDSLEWLPKHPWEEDIETPISTPEVSREVLIAQYTSVRNQMIEKSILQANSFPIDIEYWDIESKLDKLDIEKIKSVDFQNGELIIGDKRYEIKFWELTHKLAGSIKGLHIIWNPYIDGSNIMLTCRTENLWGFIWIQTQEKPLTKAKASELILWLIKNWGFSDEIPASSNTSKIPYEVVEVSWSKGNV